jgi:LCP family protein required for cell wall assembly
LNNKKNDNAKKPKKEEIKDNEKKKRVWSRLKTYQKVLIILFSTIFFLCACGAGIFYYYINSANKAIKSGTSTEVENALTPVEEPQDPVTILLLGVDKREAINDKGRADTIMLLHINPEEEFASILSIPRDTYVDIPGYGKDKINAAYAYGGEELMITTVSNFMDAIINHYLTIDFEGFVELIDELGGVDVSIDRPLEDPNTGAYISAGEHHFTGEQALAFTRSRSTELGDIARIQRQQYIIKQLIDQKLNLNNISSINKYFQIIIDNTTTDLDLMTIIAYARATLSWGLENISTGIIPTHHEWVEDDTISVQIPDEDEAKAMWERIIFNQPMSRYGIIYVNGTENIPSSMGTNQTYHSLIEIQNTGTTEWHRGGAEPFYLSYHWIDFDTKKTVIFDGERSMMPYDLVKPGETVNVDLKIISPSEPGNYILQIDMIHEGVAWFSYHGAAPLEKYVSVGVSYAANYNDNATTPNEVKTGQQFTTYVDVTNNGFMTWVNSDPQRVDLGLHWYDRDTREVPYFDADSGELPENVGHGETVTVEMKITAPPKPGRYILVYDLVHEGVTWFAHQGVIPLEIDVDVTLDLDESIVSDTSVVIFNGCGIAGAAGGIREYLQDYGFEKISLSNAEDFDFEQTMIIYREGKLENAQQAANLLFGAEIEQYSIDWRYYYTGADLMIILGADYNAYID